MTSRLERLLSDALHDAGTGVDPSTGSLRPDPIRHRRRPAPTTQLASSGGRPRRLGGVDSPPHSPHSSTNKENLT